MEKKGVQEILEEMMAEKIVKEIKAQIKYS